MAPDLQFENSETFLVYLRFPYDSQNKQRFPQVAVPGLSTQRSRSAKKV
jgi:hypothetical protein